MAIDTKKFILELKSKFESYTPIRKESWDLIESIVRFQSLRKDEILLQNGQVAKNFHFICSGALRAYVTDSEGNIYNKNIFLENDFAGSKVSLLQNTPSNFTLQALEDCLLINLDFKTYRQFIDENEDLKNFYISYLEKNWVIEKEQREISLVMEDASKRYLKIRAMHPDIDKRIPQLHIAAHLGITPTQLSRIKKKLRKKLLNQHM